MSRIFVRKRRHSGPGAGRPQFAVVAVEGAELTFYRPYLRRSELEALAEAIGAEVVYLPAGSEEGGGGDEEHRGRYHHHHPRGEGRWGEECRGHYHHHHHCEEREAED